MNTVIHPCCEPTRRWACPAYWCARAGNVAIANALGSGVLETPALPGFLPMICQTLFGEPLELPSIATWWCGEAPALEHAIKHLPELVIKPAFPSMKLEPTFGHILDSAGREAMVERMRATPHAFVAQEWMRLSQAPTWSSERERFEPRVVGLRLYGSGHRHRLRRHAWWSRPGFTRNRHRGHQHAARRLE